MHVTIAKTHVTSLMIYAVATTAVAIATINTLIDGNYLIAALGAALTLWQGQRIHSTWGQLRAELTKLRSADQMVTGAESLLERGADHVHIEIRPALHDDGPYLSAVITGCRGNR